MVENHTHDCTGPDMTCPCGFVFRVPPVRVSIEVHEGKRQLLDEHFNCETLATAIGALEEAVYKLRAIRGY